MELQKFGIKLYLKTNGTYESQDFIPVFHHWIQEKAVPDHLLIDVADYSHIPDGPGVMLVAHEGLFSLDQENYDPGILYMRKTDMKGSFTDRFNSVFFTTVHAAQLLCDNKIGKEMEFYPDSFRFITNDRRLAANTEENQKLYQEAVCHALENNYPGENWCFDCFANDNERLAFSVTSNNGTHVFDQIKESLEK